ncbi:hypothetical protein ACKKBF_B19760 [Auxenochlorella protothecoides x Auxenochlorella symbiontica]
MTDTVDDAAPARANKSRKRSDGPKTGVAKYRRGEEVSTKTVKDKKLKGQLLYTERVFKDAQKAAARVDDWLLPAAAGGLEAEGMEQTWRFHQEDIVQAVEVGAGPKAFDLSLPSLGPYALATTRAGRYLALGGHRGHLALMDRLQSRVLCEVQVKESVHDVSVLHSEAFFAAAQRKYVYIYDKRGIEVHCLKAHTNVWRLDFLPHHFLLTSVGASGVLTWQDTSTGQIVASAKTRAGPCRVLTHDPSTGVSTLGHGRGTVSLWTPTSPVPAARLLCHHGPVLAAAHAPRGAGAGPLLVTAGADRAVKVWDMRMMRALHAYDAPAPVAALDISQRGALAVGWGRRVQVWLEALRDKAAAPYLNHTLPHAGLRDLVFCPYDDVLAAGHGGGVSALLVPGAGEPNYDSLVADPFQRRKAAREAEVAFLLDKLQPGMIVLDPDSIGGLAREPKEVQKERAEAAAAANAAALAAQRAKADAKTPMKGKNKPTRKRRKKQQNVIDDKAPAMRARMAEQGVLGGGHARKESEPIPESVPRALHRFVVRK